MIFIYATFQSVYIKSAHNSINCIYIFVSFLATFFLVVQENLLHLTKTKVFKRKLMMTPVQVKRMKMSKSKIHRKSNNYNKK